MTAMAHQFAPARPAPVPAACAALTARWEAVHEAAAAVAVLAHRPPEPAAPEVLALPRRAAAIGGDVQAVVARGIEDLAAVMQPGLRALLGLTAQGRDTGPAALALWREFERSRAAMLALIAGR